MAHGNDTRDAENSKVAHGSPKETTIFLILVLTLVAFLLARFFFAEPPSPGSTDKMSQATNAENADPTAQPQQVEGQRRCEFFVLQKILSARNPVVLDHWDIDGKRVFRVGFAMSGRDDERDRLCVYDLETRSALMPAIGDQQQWLPRAGSAGG